MKTITKIITLPVLLFLCSVTSAFEVNDPIAHWKFDETSGTIAHDSTGSNNGTVIGATWSPGKINGALNFQKSGDMVRIPDSDILDPCNAFTLTAWVNATEFFGNGSQNGNPIIVKWGSDLIGQYHLTAYTGGNIDLRVADGSAYDILTVSSALSANDWHHIAAEWKGGEYLKIYVDGQLSAEKTTNISSLYNREYSEDYIDIGYDAIGNPPYWNFKGLIDDVRIYDRALSAEEVLLLYQLNAPVLTGLEITGPNEVAENSQTQYKAIAYYDDSSTKDVTGTAQWFVEPETVAAIDANGLLTTETIFKPQDITIFAEYTEDENTVDAEKGVSILAICPKGSALSFDGINDYVNCGSGISLNVGGLSSSYSVSAWFKTTATSQKLIVSKKVSADTGLMPIFLDINGAVEGQVRFAVRDSDRIFRAIETSASNYNDGNWHYVVGIRDTRTDEIRIIMDGDNVESEKDLTDSSMEVSAPFYIGVMNNPGMTAYFDGLIDDVRIYNRVLSTEEIQAKMHTLPSAVEPNLVAYWNFDEGQGQVAHDTSANGNNGFLGSDPCNPDNGDPAWVDSNAPIGICSIQELIDRNISDAIEIKLNVLDEIEQALEREKASAEMLQELAKGHNKKHPWWEPREILKRITSIRLAIVYEIWSAKAVDKSIDKLEQAQYPPPPKK